MIHLQTTQLADSRIELRKGNFKLVHSSIVIGPHWTYSVDPQSALQSNKNTAANKNEYCSAIANLA